MQAIRESCKKWMRLVERDLAGPLKRTRVEVENKRYTITFHCRGNNEPATVERVLGLLLNRLAPVLRLIAGKASVNV